MPIAEKGEIFIPESRQNIPLLDGAEPLTSAFVPENPQPSAGNVPLPNSVVSANGQAVQPQAPLSAAINGNGQSAPVMHPSAQPSTGQSAGPAPGGTPMVKKAAPKRIGDVLIEEGYITQ